jgi:hypothetical protein
MWYKVFYVPFVLPGMGGLTLGPFQFIRNDLRNRVDLHLHELKHTEQWYRNKITHGIKYLFSKDYRLEAEAEAYAENVKFWMKYNRDREDMIRFYANTIKRIKGYFLSKYSLKEIEGRIARYVP